ncbi:hypothetical protein, variant [Verruconis gallopava]|uniref:GP-PDE domain-containing protein n=1 Tax=Verruconis gallopava TaxID=253628 RepID=A0A0D1YSD9_9PEZI|nr:uncharacterized protein PV09_05277 [Verruconis gallopava]XP_016213381.1 hypothetical protein, variant [Verruconis gallopava]KIW03511.1 hypothetical protein PV09_05277 [Verruconis gallopava]KIW03512.1 hypothetical protein, variant [Verruconis gallopava]
MAVIRPRSSSLLEKMNIPPYLTKIKMVDLAEFTELEQGHFPRPKFANARLLANGVQLPQSIAHRGYKAAYPENTMVSFVGAVEAGAHALETDIHLTRDDVVVLSHDPTLKRCFGRPEKIIDCDWNFISKLRTTAEPPSPMPRLKDLLEYLASPGLENIWVLLDIKLDCDPTDVMRLIAATIASVPPSPKRPWKDRIVLGIWATKYLSLCEDYLPDFPVCFIGFSTSYARRFFSVPNISFNMLHQVLHGPVGASFIRKAKELNREIFAWTVNDENRMRWCIRKELDGVVTDDPKKFLEICKDYEELPVEKSVKSKEKYKMGDWMHILKIQVLVTVFFMLFRFKYGWTVEAKYKHVPKRRKGTGWQEKTVERTL